MTKRSAQSGAANWHTWARRSLPLLSVLLWLGAVLAADIAAADGGSGGLANLESEIQTGIDSMTRIKTKVIVFISVVFAMGAGLAGLAFLKSEGEGREKVLNVLKGIGAVYILLMIVGQCLPTS